MESNYCNKHICIYERTKTSINGDAIQYKFYEIETIDPKLFLKTVRKLVKYLIKKQNFDNVKYQLELMVEFKKETPKEIKYISNWFNSGKFIASSMSYFDKNIYSKCINTILEKIEKFTCQGSGWIISQLLELQIKVVKYTPIKGSSYIALPEKFRNSKFGLINIKNEDDKCFQYCIARHFCRDEKHSERVTKRLKAEVEKFDWNNMKFPVELNNIDTFEKSNKISINVYSFNNRLDLYPLRISQVKFNTKINLLLISHENKKHYVLMNTLSPFTNPKHNGKTYTCHYCLQVFFSDSKFIEHEKECSVHTSIRVRFKSSEDKIKFKNYDRQVLHPFVIYADFESTLQNIHTCRSNPEESYTNQIQKHSPNSFCCYTICEVDKYSKLKIYTGENCVEKFIEYLKSEAHRIYKLQKENVSMNLTDEQKQAYYNAKSCYICDKPFIEPKNNKVRDHNHLTGEFRGAAHYKCNFKIRYPKFIPVIMHNFTNYDCHLFVKQLGKYKGKLNVIPENAERYISIAQSFKVDTYLNNDKKVPIVREMRFIDSYRFLQASLDTLGKNLNAKQMKNLKKYFPNKEQFNLIKRKGIYPYDWIDSVEKFKFEYLPEKEQFYNKLNYSHLNMLCKKLALFYYIHIF